MVIGPQPRRSARLDRGHLLAGRMLGLHLRDDGWSCTSGQRHDHCLVRL